MNKDNQRSSTALDFLQTIAYFCKHSTKGYAMDETLPYLGSLIDDLCRTIRKDIEGGLV